MERIVSFSDRDFVEFDGNKVRSGLTPGFPIQGFSASGGMAFSSSNAH
ncbi:hypothetical protein KDW69_26345 [Burkholderia ambifaria]|nr:hypothetical protein [Burkholderia ambifaria]MBR8335178.1 hypothetical protein [Burkholderia ambifaria]